MRSRKPRGPAGVSRFEIVGCGSPGLSRPESPAVGGSLWDKVNRQFIRPFLLARNTANLQQNSP